MQLLENPSILALKDQIKDPVLIGIDYETYYNTEEKYSLSRMTAEEYINSSLFQIIMCAIKINNDPAYVIDGKNFEEMRAHFMSLPWDRAVVYGHNGAFFDFLILGWVFGIFPAFYMDTLLMARPLAGTGQSNTLSALADRFGLPTKKTTIYQMNGVRREDMSPQLYYDFADYASWDIELAYLLLPKLLEHWRPYDVAWMDTTMRMMAQPMFHLDADVIHEGMDKEVEREGQQLERLLQDMAIANLKVPESALKKVKKVPEEQREIAAAKKMVGSAADFAELMRGFGIEPPLKWSEKKKDWTYAFARSDGEFMDLADSDIPGAASCVEARLGVKSTIMASRLGRLEGIQRRMGVLPVPIMPFAAHCVPGDTEVLTAEGWKALESWEQSDIMQYDPNTEKLYMLPASVYRGPIVAGWVEQTGKFAQAPMTEGHTVPYYADNKKEVNVKTCKAGELLNRSRTRLVECGNYTAPNAIDIGPEQARVLCMTQADGNFQLLPTGGIWVRYAFMKQRKIERCRQLLHEANIIWRERTEISNGKEKTVFVVSAQDRPEWLSPDRKKYGVWCLELSHEAMTAIVEDAPLWDGTIKADNTTNYSSSVRENVEWMSTMAHLVGRPTGRIIEEVDRRNGTIMHVVSLRARSRHYTLEKKSVEYNATKIERAWCAKTVTGFWLARHNGKIFVTGNTGRNGGSQKLNVQNFSSRPSASNPYGKANPCRRCIVAPPGFKIYDADSSQIEVRVLGGVTGEPNILLPFADKKNCPYCTFGTNIYGRRIIKGVDKFERNVSKSAVLGNGYGQGGPGFQAYCKRSGIVLSLPEAQRIVDTYRGAHPYVVDFWDACEWALKRIMSGQRGSFGHRSCLEVGDECIILPSGRPIRYRGLCWVDRPDPRRGGMKRTMVFYDPVKRMLREVYGSLCTENIVQGAAADIIHEQGVNLRWRYGLATRLQVHDSLVFIEHEATRHDYVVKHVPEVMRVPPTWMDWIPIDCEIEEGYTYGDLEQIEGA